MARPLQHGPASPPLTPFQRTRDTYKNQWVQEPKRLGVGVADFAFSTFAAPLQSIVGAGSGRGNSVIGPGRPPMVVRPVVRVQGLAYTAGQYVSTPLSVPR